MCNPVPIFNVSEWDEVRVRKHTVYRFNWKNASLSEIGIYDRNLSYTYVP